MALDEKELIVIYHDLMKAYPEDLHIARPLIQMMQSRGDVEEARELAMNMARRMLSSGYSSYALAFLSICEQLKHPDVDEIESMKTMAELTLGSSANSLGEAGEVFELIEALSDSESQNFLEQGTLLKVKSGEDVVRQGEVSRKFYLIVDGEMRVHIDTKLGGHFDVSTLKQGDFFGEVACVYQLPRTASVTASSDATLLEFSDQTVTEMIDESPIAGDSLMKVVQRRMAESIAFTHPAFSDLDRADLIWFEEECELVEFKAGDSMLSEGGDGFFYIIGFGKAAAMRGADFNCGLRANAMYSNSHDALKFPENTQFRALERCIVCKLPIQVFEAFVSADARFQRWVYEHVLTRNNKLRPPTGV